MFAFPGFCHFSKVHPHILDERQSWWQMAFIQLSGFVSLPVLAGSALIVQNSNLASAVLTLTVGNILLWLIRLGIVAMSYEGRKSALDVAREYLGNFGSLLIAIVILASALAWFVVQTTLASNALCRLISIDEGDIDRFIQTGVFIGIASTLLCINGMKSLRYAATVCFPILLVAFGVGLWNADWSIPHPAHEGISLSGLPIFLATSLGVTADLPTFFRHSKSLRSSFTALTAIQIFSFCIGLGALFLGSTILHWFGVADIKNIPIGGLALKSSLVILIFLSAICANISSVYSASVGWELVAPILAGVKEYFILGLGMTIVFVLAANIFSLDLLDALSGYYLVNLSLIFVLAFLARHFLHRYPKHHEQTAYLIAWLAASILNTLQYFQIMASQTSSLPAAFTAIVLILVLALSYQPIMSQLKRQWNRTSHDE